MAHLTYAKKQYQQVRRLSASPIHIIRTVYSEAISACFERNTLRAIKALAALQLSLSPNDTSKITTQLNTIFEYCLQLIQNEDFDLAADALIDLRSSMTP